MMRTVIIAVLAACLTGAAYAHPEAILNARCAVQEAVSAEDISRTVSDALERAVASIEASGIDADTVERIEASIDAALAQINVADDPKGLNDMQQEALEARVEAAIARAEAAIEAQADARERLHDAQERRMEAEMQFEDADYGLSEEEEAEIEAQVEAAMEAAHAEIEEAAEEARRGRGMHKAVWRTPDDFGSRLAGGPIM